jgi:translation elongation factor EF-1beta
MILPSKELLFGKSVFDHLLLPGRGILCSTQSTRLDKTSGGGSGSGAGEGDIIPLTNTTSDSDSEPLAFTLNTASFSDKFSIIEDETKELNDKNYNWDFITNDNNITDGIKNISVTVPSEDKSDRNNQSLEELKKLRESQKF